MKTDTYERINITLPRRTLERIDKAAESGRRSHLIDLAVNAYLRDHAYARLHAGLKEGAAANAARDRELTADWFDFNDAWDKRGA